jgi:hypothetical protein
MKVQQQVSNATNATMLTSAIVSNTNVRSEYRSAVSFPYGIQNGILTFLQAAVTVSVVRPRGNLDGCVKARRVCSSFVA